jgi:hypothetical protein
MAGSILLIGVDRLGRHLMSKPLFVWMPVQQHFPRSRR